MAPAVLAAAGVAAAPPHPVMVGEGPRDPSPRTFTLFSKLPPEIRHMIWALCIPARAFEVDSLHYNSPFISGVLRCNDNHPCWPLWAPNITRVCRESRAVANLRGGWSRLAAPNYGHDITGRWTWFDGSADTLVVHTWQYLDDVALRAANQRLELGGRPPLPNPGMLATSWNIAALQLPPGLARMSEFARWYDLRAFMKKCGSVCVSLHGLTWTTLPVPRYLAFGLANWARLRQFSFFNNIIDIHLLPEEIRAQPFFVEGSHALPVHVRDTARISALSDLYGVQLRRPGNRLQQRAPTMPLGRHLLPSLTEAQVPQFLEKLKTEPQWVDEYEFILTEKLQDIWLHAQYSALPDNSPLLHDGTIFRIDSQEPSQPRFDHQHRWASDMLKSMPDYKPVVLFRLCRAKAHEVGRSNAQPARRGRRGRRQPRQV